MNEFNFDDNSEIGTSISKLKNKVKKNDNYELLADVEKNDDKFSKLKNVIKSLMEYEPERMNIQDKFPIINM